MNEYWLDEGEKELSASLEAGEWNPVENREEARIRHREAARNTLKKDKRVNLRLSARDLDALKVRAAEEGLPYQTLMASILHKYVTGRLVDRQVG